MAAPLAYALATSHALDPREMADEPTLEALYRAHFDFVYRKAARLGGPGFDAEDAAQEVFMIASRRLHTFNGTSAVTTWLYGITLNVVRRARRKQRVRQLFALRHRPDEEAPAQPDRAEVGQARSIAYQLLDKLSPKHREVFILAEFEGLSCEEIARMVDCKVETVWSRLHYARKEFAARLKKRGLTSREPT
jgi:RNA polymerase sigma-70 factor (ECF subfamily)